VVLENSNTIINARVINQQTEKIWMAWSNPDLLKQWWGPKNFTNQFHEFNFVPNGEWKFTMTGPDNSTFENYNRFTEIIPQRKIQFQHIQNNHTFTGTFEFESIAQKTLLSFKIEFINSEEFKKVADFIDQANEENLDKLEGLSVQLQ